MARETTMRYR